jgi:DNA recombination protein RmuC
MDDAPSLLRILAALAGVVVFAFLIRQIVQRRIGQAVAVARAEGDAALARSEAALRARLVEAETRLDEERRQGAEKVRLLDDAERRLSDAFTGLAARALAANNDSFLVLAGQAFEKLQSSSQGDLDQRRQAIETLLAPMREQLARYETGVRELERSREQAYGTLAEQLRSLASSQDGLVRETGRLVTALRRPEVRGNWGEVQLRRTVEFAGMLDHVDFLTQATVEGEEGRLRPDLLVRLPGGKHVVVDAKAPLDAYLAAIEAGSDEERRLALVRHARQVRNHLALLAEKRYWDQFDDAPEFVVLFLPGEAFFSAALEHDPGLLEEAFTRSVLIATPATLVALLKTVYYGWRQESLAANAREISDAARELYDRLRKFADHLGGVGKGLTGAVAAYNKAVGSFEARVLPQGRRFEALGPAVGQQLPALSPVDAAPRALAPGDEEESDT